MSRYTGHLGNNLAVLACHLQVQVKNWHVVTTYQVNTDQTTVSKLSEYGLQLAEKQKLRFSYGLGENNSVTCSYKLLKLKKELSFQLHASFGTSFG